MVTVLTVGVVSPAPQVRLLNWVYEKVLALESQTNVSAEFSPECPGQQSHLDRLTAACTLVHMNASALIRGWREAQGLTQAELAARIGVDQSYISSYESARRSPGLGVLERFASGLGGELRIALEPSPRSRGWWVPLTLASLAKHLAEEGDVERKRRLVLEFVTGYTATELRHRRALVAQRPDLDSGPWSALLAGFAEHYAFWDEYEAPDWCHEPARFLAQAWYLVDGVRMQRRARIGSPAAFARRLVFLDPTDLERV